MALTRESLTAYAQERDLELVFFERNAFGLEHETDALAAGRLRRIVENEGHGKARLVRSGMAPARRGGITAGRAEDLHYSGAQGRAARRSSERDGA